MNINLGEHRTDRSNGRVVREGIKQSKAMAILGAGRGLKCEYDAR